MIGIIQEKVPFCQEEKTKKFLFVRERPKSSFLLGETKKIFLLGKAKKHIFAWKEDQKVPFC